MEEINSKITYALKYLQIDCRLADNKPNRKHFVVIPVAERALSSEQLLCVFLFSKSSTGESKELEGLWFLDSGDSSGLSASLLACSCAKPQAHTRGQACI